jgi:succinate dehydrogenase / fumarate reductase cytochrome b subunit
MSWKHYFTTSIGKKLVMGFTGLFLISFLVVHAYINSMIFFNDGGEAFNAAADFMGSTLIIRIMEIGLFAGIILHAIQGYLLSAKNIGTRKVGYAVKPGNKVSPWYSRSMGLLGTLILMFLVLHISHFWIPSRITHDLNEVMIRNKGMHNLYERMDEVFKSGLVVIIYLLGVTSLGWHLVHGFYSAFQTMGLTTHKYKAIIRGTGIAFSILICVLFALMPLAMYFDWIQ